VRREFGNWRAEFCEVSVRSLSCALVIKRRAIAPRQLECLGGCPSRLVFPATVAINAGEKVEGVGREERVGPLFGWLPNLVPEYLEGAIIMPQTDQCVIQLDGWGQVLKAVDLCPVIGLGYCLKMGGQRPTEARP
jgi:hypothetical protein